MFASKAFSAGVEWVYCQRKERRFAFEGSMKGIHANCSPLKRVGQGEGYWQVSYWRFVGYPENLSPRTKKGATN